MLTRRELLRNAGFAGAGALLAPSLLNARDEGREPSKRPNVLILQPDQYLGTVMSCAGDANITTPNLDRLAAGGMRFTRAASCSPVCSPCRASFQTGLYIHGHGVVRNNIRLDARHVTLGELFSKAGYATGFIGKWHLDGGIPKDAPGGWVPPERRRGWQDWKGYEKGHDFDHVWTYADKDRKVDVEGYDWEPTWHTDMALDFARRQKEAGKPWAYYVAYGPPHVPKECPQKYLDMFPPEKFKLPGSVKDTPEARREYQMYYAQCYAIDVEVGRILDGLKQQGQLENTIIVFTSDHGDYLGVDGFKLRGKGAPHPSAFRIPMVIHWPEKIAAGQTSEALFGSPDLAPTLLSLTGLDVPKAMQGRDQSGWCLEGEGPDRDWLYMGLGAARRGGWRAAWNGEKVIHGGEQLAKIAEAHGDVAAAEVIRKKSETTNRKRKK